VQYVIDREGAREESEEVIILHCKRFA